MSNIYYSNHIDIYTDEWIDTHIYIYTVTTNEYFCVYNSLAYQTHNKIDILTHLHLIFRYLLTYIITANCRIINFVNTGVGGSRDILYRIWRNKKCSPWLWEIIFQNILTTFNHQDTVFLIKLKLCYDSVDWF